MNCKEVMKKIEELNYWDARVKKLECNYFADEVILTYDDEGFDVIYKFCGCYSVEIKHEIGYDKKKPIKEYSFSQIPYFIQNIDLSECMIDGVDFYKMFIDMHPIEMRLLCKNIKVDRVETMNQKK